MKTIISIFMASALTIAATGLVVNPDSVNITVRPDSIVERKLTISSGRDFFQQFEVATDEDWVKINPTNGSVDMNKDATVTLTVNTKNMKPGYYNSIITFEDQTVDGFEKQKTLVPVNLNVLEPEFSLEAIPRALEMRPGQIMPITFYNPSNGEVNVTLKPSLVWIYVTPIKLRISPRSIALVYVRASKNASSGGTFRTSIAIEGDGVEMNYPVAVKVDAGVDFNPSEISRDGSVTITNRMKKPVVIVAPTTIAGLKVDPPRIEIQAGQKKIINIKLPEKRPDKIEFIIYNANLTSYVLWVK